MFFILVVLESFLGVIFVFFLEEEEILGVYNLFFFLEISVLLLISCGGVILICGWGDIFLDNGGFFLEVFLVNGM